MNAKAAITIAQVQPEDAAHGVEDAPSKQSVLSGWRRHRLVSGVVAETLEIFENVLAFIRESGLYEVQVTFMTAFPGTPLYARLEREGRIIHDKAWELCTLFDINFTPKSMSVKQLQDGFLRLVKQLIPRTPSCDLRHDNSPSHLCGDRMRHRPARAGHGDIRANPKSERANLQLEGLGFP